MKIVIHASEQRLKCSGLDMAVRIGKAGFIDQKQGREGDAKTPLGTYTLRFGLYRTDHLPSPPPQPPQIKGQIPLVFHALDESDGWCDAPHDPAYNRFVRLPHSSSTEQLWRDDGAYDIILVMSHNDSPPVPDAGSAVFIHIAQADDRKTLGCVALTPDDMAALLPSLYCGQIVEITV